MLGELTANAHVRTVQSMTSIHSSICPCPPIWVPPYPYPSTRPSVHPYPSISIHRYPSIHPSIHPSISTSISNSLNLIGSNLQMELFIFKQTTYKTGLSTLADQCFAAIYVRCHSWTYCSSCLPKRRVSKKTCGVGTKLRITNQDANRS